MESDRLFINDEFDENDTAKYIKTYMFIKGYAVGKDLKQTMLALSLARKFHNGQMREDGTPYIAHPLKVCTTLISLGIDDDVTLSAALLHDVLEDCKDQLPGNGQELIDEYHMDPEILEIIKLLTKREGLNDEQLGEYFRRIEKNPKAALIKLSDRLHNCSTMYVYSDKKLRKYIRETEIFVIPMASYCKKYYPKYVNSFGILKREINALNHSMYMMLRRFDKKQENTDE